MMKRLFLRVSLVLCLVACSPAPVTPEPGASSEASVSSAMSSSSLVNDLPPVPVIEAKGHLWEHAVFLSDTDTQRQLMPLKKSCGDLSLEWVRSKDWPTEIADVILLPRRSHLNGLGRVVDAAFLPGCEEIIAIIENSPENTRDVYRYLIADNRWETATSGLSPRWDSIENAKPSIYFLYPIDATHILLSAHNPTTGGDAYTNQTSQGILTLGDRNVPWFTQEISLTPVVYDFAAQRMSYFDYSSNEGSAPFVVTRRDITLPELTETRTELFTTHSDQEVLDRLYSTGSSCNSANFGYEPGGYEQCMDAFWARVFPAGK